jgi:hypothetical protein
MFSEIIDLNRLRICFGHYLSEDFFGVFDEKFSRLFTGLRDPMRRSVSDYRQTNAVRLGGQQPLLTAKEYVESGPGTICSEILRAFPSLASGEPWRQALQALSLFDYVYMTESFASDAQEIFAWLGIPGLKLNNDNISSEKAMCEDDARFIEAEVEKLGPILNEYLADDLRFYEVLRDNFQRASVIPKFWPRDRFREEPWFLDRAEFYRSLPDAETCLSRIAERETGYLVYEYHLLNKLAFLREQMERRQRLQSGVLKCISGYGAVE